MPPLALGDPFQVFVTPGTQGTAGGLGRPLSLLTCPLGHGNLSTGRGLALFSS